VPATVEIVPPGVTVRMRLSPESAMYSVPSGVTVTPNGALRDAAVAMPESPHWDVGVAHALPVPATVEIVPTGVTLRILLDPVSAMYSVPSAPIATSDGLLRFALVAGPPSPQAAVVVVQAVALPATVVIVPVVGSILRMRLLPVSAMKMVPSGATVTAEGDLRFALVAAPPSPPKAPASPLPGPVPAIVEIVPFGSTLRMRLLFVSAM
jgi:hypothetical protein